MNWRARANCRNVDPNLMQPEQATPDEVGEAMQFCVGCPVRGLCQQLADEQPNPYGVHAGKWYGDPPADPTQPACGWCGEPAAAGASYCSTRCRVAAHRARHAIPA